MGGCSEIYDTRRSCRDLCEARLVLCKRWYAAKGITSVQCRQSRDVCSARCVTQLFVLYLHADNTTGKDVNFELELVEFGCGRALTRDGMVFVPASEKIRPSLCVGS